MVTETYNSIWVVVVLLTINVYTTVWIWIYTWKVVLSEALWNKSDFKYIRTKSKAVRKTFDTILYMSNSKNISFKDTSSDILDRHITRTNVNILNTWNSYDAENEWYIFKYTNIQI